MLIFIGVTLSYHLTKYGKDLIYESLHKSKHQYFGYFHESKHQDFGSFHESNHQYFGNLDEFILWKLKRIVSHEGNNIVYHPNVKGSWYNVMVKWGTGETITESLTIIIGVKPSHVLCMWMMVRKKGSDINQEGFTIYSFPLHILISLDSNK